MSKNSVILKVFLFCGLFSTAMLFLFATILLKFEFKIDWKDNKNANNFTYKEHDDLTKVLISNIQNFPNQWQEIKEMEIFGLNESIHATQFSVYSAYLDFYKTRNIVRIIAIIPASFFENQSKTQEMIFCHVLNQVGKTLGVFPTTIRPHLSSSVYRDVFLLCELDFKKSMNKQRLFQEMKYVSVSPSKGNHSFSNIIPITMTSTTKFKKEPHKFSVCVQPTFEYDRVFEFVQWMEFHKMMGVSHFTFYNVSIGPRVSCVMKSKAAQLDAVINVLNWTIPQRNKALIHVNAQNSQMNECNYRYRGVASYVISVDLDEIIIPSSDTIRNYDHLIKAIHKGGNYSQDSIAQYNFQCGFFPSFYNKNDPLPDLNNIKMRDLYIHKYSKRQKDLFPHKDRSKHISIPLRVVKQETHFLSEPVGNEKEVHVLPELAFLHHYRPNDAGKKKLWKEDLSGHYFTPELLKMVQSMMGKLREECNLV